MACLLSFMALGNNLCSVYATRNDCLYAPEPRCSWDTTAGNLSCVCALDSCAPVDLCVFEAADQKSCDVAVLPNGAPCTWNATGGRCTCKNKGCATHQPSCHVDQHCQSDCEFPCKCAAGHCYLVDECWRFDGPQCELSMWHGVRCCNGHSTGGDKGCFLCEQAQLCRTLPPAPTTHSRALPLPHMNIPAPSATPTDAAVEPEAWSLDGKPLYAPSFSGIALEALNAQLSIAVDALATPPTGDPAKHVWLGRRLAYKWQYREALKAYSTAISTFPRDAKLHRHRGHRYVTTRNFTKAEADLHLADTIIATTTDEWEPDGEPNAYNLPLSSFHFNVRYHLGLSRYLMADYDGALDAYARMATSGPYANDESLVATAHWTYMAIRRSGHGADSPAARAALAPVHEGMRSLDGGAYLNLTLAYKGLRPIPDLMNASALDVATLGYGVGCYHYYSGRQQEGIAVWRRVVNSSYWAAFGFIAAEAELHRLGLLERGRARSV